MDIRFYPFNSLPIDLIRTIESYLTFWDVRTISQYSSSLDEKEYFARILFSDSQHRLEKEWERIINYFWNHIAQNTIESHKKPISYTEKVYKELAEKADPTCEKSIQLFYHSLQAASSETDFKEQKATDAFFNQLYTNPTYPPRLHFFIIALRQQKEANRRLSRILQQDAFYSMSDLSAVTILHCCFLLGMTPVEFFEEWYTTNSRLLKMAVEKDNERYFRDLSTLLISPIKPFTPHFSVLNVLGQVLWYTVTLKTNPTVIIRKQGIIDILHLAGGTLEIKQALFEFYAQINYIRTLQNSPYATNHRHLRAPSYVTNIKHLPLNHRHLVIPNSELADMEALADEMLSPLYEKIIHHSDKPLTDDEKKQDVELTIKKIHAINNFQSLNQQWEIYMSRPTLNQHRFKFGSEEPREYTHSKKTIIQAFHERAFALLSSPAENKKDLVTIETVKQYKNLLRGPLFGEEKLNHFHKKQTDHELKGVSPTIRHHLEKKLFELLHLLFLRGKLNQIPKLERLIGNFQTRHDLSMMIGSEKAILLVDEIIQSRIMYWIFGPSHRSIMGLDYGTPHASSTHPEPSAPSALLAIPSSESLPKPSAPPAPNNFFTH